MDDSSGLAGVLLTGAASGIALETACDLARRNPDVGIALLDRDAAALEEAKAKLADRRGKTVTLAVDVREAKEVEDAVKQAADALGTLTGAVTAAGVRMANTPAVDLDDETWWEVVTVNLFGCFATTRAVGRAMIAGRVGGSIVTVSSLSAKRARWGQSAYCAAKAGVSHFSRVMALELATHGIRVNSVCPGTVNTAMLQKARQQDGPEVLNARIFGSPEKFRPGIPSRRVAEPSEVSSLIIFLLSDESRHITGAAINIDGGEGVI